MPEALDQLLALHRDRKQFPREVLELLADWNVEASAVVLAWELSGFAPGPQREPLFAISLALLATQAQGHTRMALARAPGGLADLLLRAFRLGDLDTRAFLESAAPAFLVGRLGEAKPLILDGDWLYTQRSLAHEQDLADRVGALLATPSVALAAAPEAVFQLPRPLNGEQRRAVEMAMTGNLTLITGGPGTGKTSIIAAILRSLLHQPGLTLADIALAAPTGKAAQRMGESIQANLAQLGQLVPEEQPLRESLAEPRTLHRLLAWHALEETFRHGPGNPLAAKVVLVDEASMISQEHLCLLLGALAPGARLVLLGDAHQLPSVEEGCAFRELLATLPGNRVELAVSYRMREEDPEGRNILSVALAIKDNQVAGLWQGPEPIHVRASLEEVRHRQVELLDPGGDRLGRFLEAWFTGEVLGLPGFADLANHIYPFQQGAWGGADLARLEALFTHFKGFRILCALREAGQLRGVEEINGFFHERMLRLTGEGLKGPAPFCAGEPVLMTANDYRRGIYNGDQGLVLKVAFEGQLRQTVVFPRDQGFVPFPLEPLKHQIEHAFAMTVHKSQGSEYRRIAIVLPRNDHKALTRELLYTGLTRAEKSVILLSEPERIPFAAGNPSVRDSGLAARLRRNSG